MVIAQLAAPTRHKSNGRVIDVLARIGVAARGVVYLVMGWLAIQIATGDGRHEADQHGALADIARHPFGVALLSILAVGFAAYAVWRFAEVIFGTATEGKNVGARVQSGFGAAIYAIFSASTFSFVAGHSRQEQTQQQVDATARVMRHTGGRWLVAIIGLVFVGIGIGMAVQGITRQFRKELRDDLTGRARTVVMALGFIGTIARGLIFALAGALVVDAAVTFDPAKSTGLDGALRTLASQPLGPLLLGAVAGGLIMFALFGFAEVRWIKT